MKPIINWKVRVYDEMNVYELYEMLKLRSEVFVVEQNCVYQDLDGLDSRCIHIFGWSNDGRLAAYARILPEGVDAYEVKDAAAGRHGGIGRVVVSPAFRGIGHDLMAKTLEVYDDLVGSNIPCIIHAQAHLKHFYETHGFVQTSEIYLIDGIDHIEMTRPGL